METQGRGVAGVRARLRACLGHLFAGWHSDAETQRPHGEKQRNEAGQRRCGEPVRARKRVFSFSISKMEFVNLKATRSAIVSTW
jgi:hypothetical protein